MKDKFELVSKYSPQGDQPAAIEMLVEGIKEGKEMQTLLGATGTGKTFTVSNVIKRSINRLLSLPTIKRWQGSFTVSSKSSSLIMPSNTSLAIMITTSQRLMFHPRIHSSKKMQASMMKSINCVTRPHHLCSKGKMSSSLPVFRAYMDSVLLKSTGRWSFPPNRHGNRPECLAAQTRGYSI